MKKQGQLMEIDILVAIALLIGGLLLTKSLYIHTIDTPQLASDSYDAARSLQTRTIAAIDQDLIKDINNEVQEKVTPLDGAETIGWAATRLFLASQEQGDDELKEQAATLVEEALKDILQGQNYNITVLASDKRYTLRSSDEPIGQAATQSRIMISGLELHKPVYGHTASAYLANAQTEQSTYTYFGGFVGQGNITVYLDLPSDAISLYLEGDFHASFDIAINDRFCDAITVPANIDPFETITAEQLDHCLGLLDRGANKITINFTTDDIDNHYIGGGFIKATHQSDYTYTPQTIVTETYRFPGIRGIFNLYDAIYLPGSLKDMAISLHYQANPAASGNNVFFAIGDRVIYEDNTSTGEQTITITDEELQALMDYEDYANQTIPLRFGYDNTSAELVSASIIDAAIVTDVSGSMDWRFDQNNNAGIQRDCDDAQLYDVTTKRLSVAQCASKNFTTSLLEDPADHNRLALVSYSTALKSSLAFTEDEQSLTAEIEDYDAGGSTCICCGILESAGLFAEDHENGREQATKAILIMTDGEANVRCAGTLGTVGDLDGDGRANGEDDHAVAAACKAHEEQNASIYVVGFGRDNVIDEEALQAMASCDNATHYYHANDPESLVTIYNDIARDIIRLADYNAQTITFPEQQERSILYPDSTITYTYETNPLTGLKGQLLIDDEQLPFTTTCTGTEITYPPFITPLHGKATSYSGNHWTDRLTINDEPIYDLQNYGETYQALGDPYIIGIPAGTLRKGQNTITLRTADAPSEPKGCSPYDKILYTAAINNTITLDAVLPEAIGCTWTAAMIDPQTTVTIRIPAAYDGENECTYDAENSDYEQEDALQALAYQLFSSFDFDQDGILDIAFDEQSLTMTAEEQGRIPYLWGPAIMEVTVWQ